MYSTPNTTAGASRAVSAFYRRTALDNLTPIFVFYELCEPDSIPKQNGKVIQWFRYNLFGSNTTPHSEGVVGTSLTVSDTTVTATMKEYGDFISASSFLTDTDLDDTITSYARILGIRAAQSVDTITRTEFDSVTTNDGASIGTTFTATDIRSDVAKLKGVNVLPKSDGFFRTVVHPYMTFDLMSDNTAGGWVEIAKYAEPNRLLSGEVGTVGGSRVMETTNVQTSGSSPNVLYYSYTVGQGAVGAVDLAGSGPSKVRDPQKTRFSINVIPGGPSPTDPEGVIGGYVSYLYRYVCKSLDASVPRQRKTYADASLV